MKKIYMSPEMDVIELKQRQMLLAGSGFDEKLDEEGGDGGNALSPEYEWFGLHF